MFKVTKPVKIIHNYFGEEVDDQHSGEIDDLSYLFIPFANRDITVYDRNEDKRRKRIHSGHVYECQNEEVKEDDVYDQLLLSRETHSCVYKGFENHFQKLFDQEADILFQNWTIHGSYGDELSSAKSSEQFIKEILSFKEMDQIIKSTESNGIKPKGIANGILKHQSFMMPKSELIKIRNQLKSSSSQQSQGHRGS